MCRAATKDDSAEEGLSISPEIVASTKISCAVEIPRHVRKVAVVCNLQELMEPFVKIKRIGDKRGKVGREEGGWGGCSRSAALAVRENGWEGATGF